MIDVILTKCEFSTGFLGSYGINRYFIRYLIGLFWMVVLARQYFCFIEREREEFATDIFCGPKPRWRPANCRPL